MQKQMLIEYGPRRQRLMANVTLVTNALVHLSHVVTQSFPVLVLLPAQFATRKLARMRCHVTIQVVDPHKRFVAKLASKLSQRLDVDGHVQPNGGQRAILLPANVTLEILVFVRFLV
jgi:hypothetical protein